MKRLWNNPPPVHLIANGVVACGAKLTARQHAARSTRDAKRVTCEKCERVVKKAGAPAEASR